MPIKRPFLRKEAIHTQTDIEAWETVVLADDETVTAELRGKTFLISPAFGDSNREQHHHNVEIEVEGPEGSLLNIHMGHAPVDSQYDRVFSTYYYTIDFKNVKPGTFVKDYPAAYGSRRRNWWLIEVKPDIKVTQIKHSYLEPPEGIYTAWMHESVKSHEFMGGRMHYSTSFPCDYDSDEDTRYPLIISVGGSGELGDDKGILVQTDPGCVITKFRDHFENYKAFNVTIQIPYSRDFTETVPDAERAPYHDGWSTYYHERGHGMIGCREIIQKLLDDPDHNIDPNRIYLTGFSGGGLFSFEGLKGGRDIFAAVVPIGGWPIAGAYANVELNTYWDAPFPDGGESLKDRLKKEILRSRHIPTTVCAGSSDGMRYGSAAFVKVAKELGVDSRYKEYPTSHGGSPKLAWADTSNLKWLFDQSKGSIPIDPYPNADYSNFVIGDMNDDGKLTNGDIKDFVQALTDPEGYAESYPLVDPNRRGDFTGDGKLTNADISRFVNALTNGVGLNKEQKDIFIEAFKLAPLNTRKINMIKLTAEASGYYYVVVDGADTTKHVAEREATETALNVKLVSPEKVVYLEHRYKVAVEVEEKAIEVQP